MEVVQLHQPHDGIIHAGQLDQRHLPVLGEELKGHHVKLDAVERIPQVIFLHRGGNVRQMQGWGGRVDVGVVLAAGLLEPMQGTGREVLGQACVGLSLLGELDILVLARHDADLLVPQFHLVQVVHGQECLLRLSHLDQGGVFLVEQDLDALDVTVDAKEGEEVVALRQVLFQVRYQEDAAGPRPRLGAGETSHAGLSKCLRSSRAGASHSWESS